MTQMRQKIPQHLINKTEHEFKSLLGKRVECIHKGEKRVGILQFAGVNDLLHGRFQVTLSRTPLWSVDRNTVKLFKNK